MNPMEQFKATYFNEAAELVEEMERCLLAVDTHAHDAGQIDALFRAVHSIKGGALAFGFSDIASFTHVLETLLDNMRADFSVMDTNRIDTLLKARDVIAAMVTAKRDGVALANDFGANVLAALQADEGTPAPSTHADAFVPESNHASEHVYEIYFAPQPELFLTGNEPLRLIRELASLGTLSICVDSSQLPPLAEMDPTASYLRWNMVLTTDVGASAVHEVFEFVEHVCTLTVRERVAVAHEAPSSAVPATVEDSSTKSANVTTIRVDTDKVDSIIDMVGELLIAQTMLAASSQRTDDVAATIDMLTKRTRELQEAVMSIRMQPVKSLFARIPRVVRDTASQLGKQVELLMHGEQTELDKTVIEKLSDPLTHMIRNAIDHGIESPEARQAANKAAHGTVTLSAYPRSGRIIIELADDGAGINRTRLLAKATERGLVPADKTLSDTEIDQLIFLPGLTTADAITNVSGRGVGMDVVRRNIESIGGSVRVVNQPNVGVTFLLSLPLTLATVDGMIVRVGNEHYIIPMASIIETLRPHTADIRTLSSSMDVVSVRGEYIRFMYLHRIFGIADAQTAVEQALLVLVETTQGPLGLVVDELLGEQQVVVKNLAAGNAAMRGFFGATILGDGRVSLILEVNDILSIGSAATARDAQVA